MGWVLAGLELETKPQRKTMTAPSVSRDKAAALAVQIAVEEKLSWISAQQVSSALQSMDDGVTYLIDVRSEDEFEAGHISGSINVPGGQAVQRADDFVAVRNAQIVFISNESARAVMAAYWYRQMGFVNVLVLQGGLRAWSEGGETLVSGAIQNEPLSFEAAKQEGALDRSSEIWNENCAIPRHWSSMSARVSNSNRRMCREPNGFRADGSSLNFRRTFPIELSRSSSLVPMDSNRSSRRVRYWRSAIRMLPFWTGCARMGCGGVFNGTGTRWLLGAAQRRCLVAFDPRQQGRYAALSGLGA